MSKRADLWRDRAHEATLLSATPYGAYFVDRVGHVLVGTRVPEYDDVPPRRRPANVSRGPLAYQYLDRCCRCNDTRAFEPHHGDRLCPWCMAIVNDSPDEDTDQGQVCRVCDTTCCPLASTICTACMSVEIGTRCMEEGCGRGTLFPSRRCPPCTLRVAQEVQSRLHEEGAVHFPPFPAPPPLREVLPSGERISTDPRAMAGIERDLRDLDDAGWRHITEARFRARCS